MEIRLFNRRNSRLPKSNEQPQIGTNSDPSLKPNTSAEKVSAQTADGLPAVKRLDTYIYTEAPVLNRFVFICGLHRSGTTLLERLIANKFDVSFLRANTPESEGQHMQTVFPIAGKYGGPGRFGFSEDMVAALKALPDHLTCRKEILESWSNFVVGSSDVLLEKSPPNLTKIAWLRSVFPGSKFIVMTRDPRAVAGATQKWSKTMLPELILHWNAAYTRAMADFCSTDCITVRYEDLGEDLDKVLSDIASFCDFSVRTENGGIENRFAEFNNSNAKYLGAHKGRFYGTGIWSRFGYDL